MKPSNGTPKMPQSAQPAKGFPAPVCRMPGIRPAVKGTITLTRKTPIPYNSGKNRLFT